MAHAAWVMALCLCKGLGVCQLGCRAQILGVMMNRVHEEENRGGE